MIDPWLYTFFATHPALLIVAVVITSMFVSAKA